MSMGRAEGLSSSTVNRVEEEKHVVEALQRNDYPKGFIQRQTCLGAEGATKQNNETRATLTLPYIAGLSESIRLILSPLAIRVAFRPFKTLMQELVHPKDPVPVSKQKGVIYSIPCAECPWTYNRQTGKSLDLCLQNIIEPFKKGDVTASAVAEHVFEAGHQMDFTKASVIDYHPHTQTHCVESWHTQYHQALSTERKAPCQDSMLLTRLSVFMYLCL